MHLPLLIWGSQTLGVKLSRVIEIPLIGYCDVDWAGDVNHVIDKMSQTRFLIYFGEWGFIDIVGVKKVDDRTYSK